MARVGIYGGSFNPPHFGHSLAAREMTDRLGLDRLLIVPAAVPPHKALPDGSPGAADRLELCRLAFAGIPKAEVCDLELRREGPSYTIDTLRALRQSLPDDELFLMMGTDMLLSFDLWREPEEIARLATLAVVRREESEAVWDEVRRKAASLSRTLPARIVLVENRCVQVSSTTVRRLLALGAPWALEPAVERRILEGGWYLSGCDLKNLPFDRLSEISLSLHDEKRRPHVLGTSQTARALALRWGAVNIMLLHNHPSGDPTPSGMDKEITERICKAGQILGIQLIDHLIIGDLSFTSLRECGCIPEQIPAYT